MFAGVSGVVDGFGPDYHDEMHSIGVDGLGSWASFIDTFHDQNRRFPNTPIRRRTNENIRCDEYMADDDFWKYFS